MGVTEIFGTRLARLRALHGLSQSALARQSGVGQALISMLEDGQRQGARMQSGRLLALARCLGVSMEYLLCGVSAPRPRRKRVRTEGGN